MEHDIITDSLTLILLWIIVLGGMGIARIEIGRPWPRILLYLGLLGIVVRFCWWGDL
jgi:hypothetical protein